MAEQRMKWPEPEDEREVVNEMLRDGNSPHWDRCYAFVEHMVDSKGKYLPVDLKEDVVQETMLSIHRSLPTFRFSCKLTTWLASIVSHRIIDEYRLSQKRVNRSFTDSNRLLAGDSDDDTWNGLQAPTSQAAEEKYIVDEQIREAMTEISAFINSHAHAERNRKIVDMVLFRGCTLDEAAMKTKISAPVAGYVIRCLRQHLRERLR